MYHPITGSEFELRMRQIGASSIDIAGTEEMVFELPIRTKSGKTFPETVRIYSTISKRNTGMSRKVGTDAIRIVLFRDDRVLISTKRVNRSSKPAVVLERVVDRVRSAFKYAITPENRGPSGHLYTKGKEIE
jgi:hypothetical protein